MSLKTQSRNQSLALAVSAGLLIASLPGTALATEGAETWRAAEQLERTLAALPRTFQFTNLLDITTEPNPPGPAAGGVYLIRSRNGLTANLMAAHLEPGHPYTVWWIIFNQPGACATTPCSAPDLMTAGGAVHYATGGVAGAGGELNLTFSTDSGGPPEGAAFNPTLPKTKLSKNAGFRAEVHLVLVDHHDPAALTTGLDPGSWAWELTHPLPRNTTNWVRAAIFEN